MGIKLPIVSHHCTTTHSACDCVLKRLNDLEREKAELVKRLEGIGNMLIDKFALDEVFANSCSTYDDGIEAVKEVAKQVEDHLLKEKK